LKSIANSLHTIDAEIVVVPPVGARIPSTFRNVVDDPELHRWMLAAVQRFRGSVYLADQAVTADELTPDGRHNAPVDTKSWHVVTLDASGKVLACLRYLEERTGLGFDRLWVRNAAISHCPQWGGVVRRAVEKEMEAADREGVHFGEVGGWAVEPERRRTSEALRTILATYGLLQVLGDSVGVATATRRHGSAPILRRIGLEPLRTGDDEVPAYFDPQYGCEMELLRYDSRQPNPKFRDWVEELAGMLREAPVIAHPVMIPRPGIAPASIRWTAPARNTAMAATA
jgi:hypothetical protein